MLLKEVIEALVFASQKPLTAKEIVGVLRAALDDSDEEDLRILAKSKEAEIVYLLEELQVEYLEQNRAFQLLEQASGWAIVTKPSYAVWVRQLYPESKPSRLSGPALETLAIIAYRQPITRADIEAVRGVAVDGVMQSLLDKSLVRIAGRAEIPGRPLLYETTQVFMEHFGLRSLQELPNSDELRRVNLPAAPPQAETAEPPTGEEAPAAEAPAEPAAEPAPEPASEEPTASGSDEAATPDDEPEAPPLAPPHPA